MLYISGSEDTLDSLRKREEYPGNLEQYTKEFAARNPELCKQFLNYTQFLPPYILMQLVTTDLLDFNQSAEVTGIVNGYTISERMTIRSMQEDNHDIPSHVASASIIEDFYSFLGSAKHVLSYPLFSTPIYEFDKSLTSKSLIKMTGETLKQGSKLVESSPAFINKMNFLQLMKRRDELNHEWYRLPKGQAHAGARARIMKETQELTKQLKQLVPRKISENAGKYVHGFPTHDAKKMSKNSTSLKTARKGELKIKLTHIERLNKSGLALYQRMIKGFTVLGNGIKKAATYTNYSLAGYEIIKSIREGGNAFRTAFREGAAIYTGTVLSAAAGGTLAGLGGIAIGTLAGDAALGAVILVCYPIIGWVVLVIAGAALAGYVSYQTKDVAERVWDAVESGYVNDRVYEFAGWIFDEFKYLGQQIIKNDL